MQQDHKKGTTAPLVGTRYKGTPGTYCPLCNDLFHDSMGVVGLVNGSKQVLQALKSRESFPEEVYCYEERQETMCMLVKTSYVERKRLLQV